MLSLVLALAAGISWGVADFLGGLNSRHLPLGTVLLVSQTVGLLLLLPLAVTHGWPLLDGPTAAYAVAGSVSGLIGIAALYRGMAVGSISIVAPISGTGAALPILFGLIRGERATTLQSVGIALAVLGILLASRAVDDQDAHARVTLEVARLRAAGRSVEQDVLAVPVDPDDRELRRPVGVQRPDGCEVGLL